jgi:lysosomal acid lipase/cholesteryl ester hydrolase
LFDFFFFSELSNRLASAVTIAKPELVFLLFGKKAMLHQTMFYRYRLSPSLLVKAFELSCWFLFGWDMKNIDEKEKQVLYSHLYSYGSVKTVVHWFQISKKKRLQMYDDNIRTTDPNLPYHNYVLPGYPVSRIKCPIAVFCGGRDTIPDFPLLTKELPPSAMVFVEKDYEHLDFQWASTAPERVFQKVISLTEQYSGRQAALSKENLTFVTFPKKAESH